MVMTDTECEEMKFKDKFGQSVISNFKSQLKTGIIVMAV